MGLTMFCVERNMNAVSILKVSILKHARSYISLGIQRESLTHTSACQFALYHGISPLLTLTKLLLYTGRILRGAVPRKIYSLQ